MSALRHQGLEIPFFVDTPAAIGFYVLVAWAVDQWLWHRPRLRGWLGVPDIRGNWNVTIRTSHDKQAEAVPATAQIRQTWSKLSITLSTPLSESASTAAHVVEIASDGGYQVVYEYENHPRAGAPDGLARHSGTAWLRLSADGQMLTGEYYTSAERRTAGALEFRRRST